MDQETGNKSAIFVIVTSGQGKCFSLLQQIHLRLIL